MKFIIYIILTICMICILSCFKTNTELYIAYKVTGEKTNVTITYRDVSERGEIGDIKTVKVDYLPWEKYITIDGEENDIKKFYKNRNILSLEADAKGNSKKAYMYLEIRCGNIFYYDRSTTNNNIKIGPY